MTNDAVIFLDIDGVLNDRAHSARVCDEFPSVAGWSPVLGAAMLDPARVARLQHVCDVTGASIVIVSGWRRWAQAPQIAACLAAAGLRATVLGTVGGVRFSGDTRCEATREWLDAAPHVTRWCVIDDGWMLWGVPLAPWLHGRLIVPDDGFSDEDAAEAIAVLASLEAAS